MAVRVAFLILCFGFALGFLLDDKTTPATQQQSLGLSDQHYQALLTLINVERAERQKLQKRVDHLEKELLVMEKGVTEMYHQNQALNQTIDENEQQINLLISANKFLQRNNDKLSFEVDDLKANNTEVYTELALILQDVSNLKQLRVVWNSNLSSCIQNENDSLIKELMETNSKLNSFAIDLKARSQDILDLHDQCNSTEKKLEQVETLHTILTTIIRQQNQSLMNSMNRLENLEYDQNVTAEKLGSGTVSGGVILTAYGRNKEYSDMDIILFSYVNNVGVSADVVADFKKTGIFTVEKEGIYLLSVYVTIYTVPTTTYAERHFLFRLHKNKYHEIGNASIDLYQSQTSTIVLTQHLNINDTLQINIRSGNHTKIPIAGGFSSCLTLIQLS